MPSASKGETWPKRLPSPGPLGSKVSKLWKSSMRPISGAIRTAKVRSAKRTERAADGAAVGRGSCGRGKLAPFSDPRPTSAPSEVPIRLTANSSSAQMTAVPISQIRPGKL